MPFFGESRTILGGEFDGVPDPRSGLIMGDFREPDIHSAAHTTWDSVGKTPISRKPLPGLALLTGESKRQGAILGSDGLGKKRTDPNEFRNALGGSQIRELS